MTVKLVIVNHISQIVFAGLGLVRTEYDRKIVLSCVLNIRNTLVGLCNGLLKSEKGQVSVLTILLL